MKINDPINEKMLTNLSDRYIIFCDGQPATIRSTGSGVDLFISFPSGKPSIKVDRDELLDMYTDERVRFYTLARVGSELFAALYDVD